MLDDINRRSNGSFDQVFKAIQSRILFLILWPCDHARGEIGPMHPVSTRGKISRVDMFCLPVGEFPRSPCFLYHTA